MVNTLIVLVCVVPISVVIATITCFGIWRSKSNLGKAILGISNVSLATPDAITAISLSLLFASTWTALGFDLGLFTVILAHISFCVPYAIIAIYPRMIKMNKNLILASYDLGYGKFKTFFKVIVPYLLPSILAACAIAAAMSLDDFVITNLVNGSSQTISTAIYTTRKGIKAWVVTFGAIMIMASILSVFIVSIVKIIKEKRGINNEKK